MDDLARIEYPAMLANLQPSQAVQALTDRVKRITKINIEIADWLQERRKVEEVYVQNLRKLGQFKVPNSQSELGVFQGPWEKILQSVDATAHSHHLFASRLEKDVEAPLRNFSQRKEMQNMHTITANLTSMARDLEDARDKSDKLNKKGGKANSQKVDAASTKLESTNSQWESQAPFIFETLQALDEQRINQLRDLLTQFQTHESDQAERNQSNAADTLASMLEISTEQEIQSFVQKTIAGRPQLEKRTTRQSSIVASSSLAPPSQATQDDDTSDHSGQAESKTESRLRSRIGTMLGRRRQTIHAGFGQLSPQKSSGAFSRNIGSSHGRPGISPRPSMNNFAESSNKLSSLAETPDSPKTPKDSGSKDAHEATNGVQGTDGSSELVPVQSTSSAVNGQNDLAEVAPPLGPPPSQAKEASKDAEGFTIPPVANDPISQAQKEAAEDSDQPFKLNIQNEPIEQEDPDAKQAAISNVANTLTQMAIPSRKTGTIRGRRDVRNTIYVPSPNIGENSAENPFPPSPALPGVTTRPSAVSTLASEASITGTSDSQSIRSSNSLGGLPLVKHPEMLGPGLNSSVIETVSATFEDGVVKNAKISGEIAFSYNFSAAAGFDNKETIRINNFANLEVIGPNRIFVQNVSPDQPDQFTLDLSHISKTATGFTYRVHSEDSDAAALAEYAPLLVRSAWKPQGDKLGLLLQYSLNPASKLTAPVTLHNVVFVATYEGANASGAQTKPSGTHLKDKHLVYWRLGDVTLTTNVQKIVCRIVGLENAEPKPGHVEARWEYSPAIGAEAGAFASGITISRLEESKGKGKEEPPVEDDPFADDNPTTPALAADQHWAEVPLVRKLVGGKYEAK